MVGLPQALVLTLVSPVALSGVRLFAKLHVGSPQPGRMRNLYLLHNELVPNIGEPGAAIACSNFIFCRDAGTDRRSWTI
jgi:hypothetical protein